MVKVYDQYQVMPTDRSGQRAENPLSPEEAAAPGRAISRAGQAIGKAGSDLGDLVLKAQEKANKVVLNDAFNKASMAAHDLRYNKDQGYLRLKGGDAVKGIDGKPITTWYSDELEKRIGEIRNGLGNSVVIEQFDLVAGDLRTKFRNDAVSYEAEQGSVYAEQVRDATIMTSANDLAADPFGKAAPFYIGRARDAAIDKARTAGMDGEALDGVVKQTMGKVHTSVIEGLLDTKNVAGAKTYFELHRGDFAEVDAKTVQGKLQTAYDADAAIKAVDEVLAAHPLVLNQPAKRSDMDAALRTIYKDDPAGLKAARAELSQRVSDHEFQENEANAGNVSGVWSQLLGGASMAQVESSRAWLSLPGEKRASLKQAWDNFSTSTIPDEMYADWLGMMMDDDALAKATGAQIAAMEPFYGRSLTTQLATRARAIQAERSGDAARAQMASPKIDTDLFQSIATTYGLPAYSDDLDDAQRKSLAIFRSQLETVVAQTQAATGKVIPPADMPEFLRKAAARIKDPNTTAARWLGGMSPALQGKIPVQLPAPGTPESAAIAQYLQQKKLPPTVENQRRALLDLGEAGSYLVDE